MSDQAAELREMFAPEEVSLGARSIAITGGKGGVGKSHVAANLALAFATEGKRALLVDADLSMANLDVLFRVSPRATLEQVVSGELTMEACLLSLGERLSLLPASSGVRELSSLTQERRSLVLEQLGRIAKSFDVVIIDTAAGIGPETRAFLQAASHTALVTTPEPTALTDAYALLKAMSRDGSAFRIGMILNMVAGEEDARRSAQKLSFVAKKFLGKDLDLLGWVPRDSAVLRATREQRPFLQAEPRSRAACAVRMIATRFLRRLEEGA